MIRIGIDIGGTFTDFVAWRDGCEGALLTFKQPSTPPDFAQSVKTGLDRLFSEVRPEPDEAVVVIHGTTVSTNMVIERAGSRVGFLTTKGFKDVLNLQRLRLKEPTGIFNVRPKSLVPRKHVIEIDERLRADGSVEKPIDIEGVVAAARMLADDGIESIAVGFLHSFRNPVHERAAAEAIAATLPDMDVSLSSAIWPQSGEYERSVVAILNSYVKKRMKAYLGEIQSHMENSMPQARLFVTQSNGGALSAEAARETPVHTLLSGPASGVRAAQFLGGSTGNEAMLTLDMGGTSTDISLIRDGIPTVSSDAEVGEFPLMMPVTGIEAIGAGGGSLIRVVDNVLEVGPQSAQAYPGPACYQRGGTRPALTDAYLACGYISPDYFLGGAMTLSPDLAQTALASVAEPMGKSASDVAEAAIRIATANMVASVMPYLARHGVHPEAVTLVLFGGAGGLQGPLLAREIGVRRIVVPETSSVFCAFGGLVSELTHDVVETLQGQALTGGHLAEIYRRLTGQAKSWLDTQVVPSLLVQHDVEYWLSMRYAGQSFQLDVPIDAAVASGGDLAAVAEAFHAEHVRRYSHNDPEASVEILEARVRVKGAMSGPSGTAREDKRRSVNPDEKSLVARRTLLIDGDRIDDAAIHARHAMAADQRIKGPAIIEQDDATVLVPGGYAARLGEARELIIEMGA
ncbi:MAG: hydantoinase/oxoprolinase family protein [Martelella sp.]|uniref:hydantoinase/oxoprolinase family protein n=1 Tax=Martelella sp. TaxID=1969699 RepID=UPI003242459E